MKKRLVKTGAEIGQIYLNFQEKHKSLRTSQKPSLQL
jgi:hypothetical protein